MQKKHETGEGEQTRRSWAKGLVATTIMMLATYGLMKKGNYRAAFLFYQKGGAGLNLYKISPQGRYIRRAALDYHPVWFKEQKEYLWRPHFHYGPNSHQVKKHRPFEGGWLPSELPNKGQKLN